MDPCAELNWEHAALIKADLDIEAGEARVGRQANVISNLRAQGCATYEAERLLNLLRETLAQWREHRTLILQRIEYLGQKPASSARD